MHADTYIPRRLDDAWKIGFWDADIAAPPIVMFGLGYLADSKLVFAACMALGLGCSRWLSRIKADKHPAFALHWMYWWLPANPLSALQCTPPSHLLRLIG